MVVAVIHGYLGTALVTFVPWSPTGESSARGLLEQVTLEGVARAEALLRSDRNRDAGGAMGQVTFVARPGSPSAVPSLIEFALVFPMLLLVMLGIIDFGRLFQRYEVLTNAAREGTRVAVLPGYNASRRAAARGPVSGRGRA